MSCERGRGQLRLPNAEQTHAYLVAEGVEELDRISLDDGVNGAGSGLQVGEDVVREELDDIDEGICRGDSLLEGRSTRGDRGEEEDGRVLALPLGGRVGGVLLWEDARSAAAPSCVRNDEPKGKLRRIG